MSVKLKILFLLAFLGGIASESKATIFEVINTHDSGVGSLRYQITEAGTNDTILINVKGTITLNSQIDIIGKGALTIIGPYPKHNTITAGGTWTGSLLNIQSSGPFIIQGLGFDSGNGNTRHVNVKDAIGEIHFKECLFANNNVTLPSHQGAAVYITNSETSFSACSFIDNQCDSATLYGNNSRINCTNSTFSGNIGNSDAGAIRVSGGSSELHLLHNTFVYNEGRPNWEAIRVTGGVELYFEGNAIGHNGTGQQVSFSGGSYVSTGLNVIRQNYFGESGVGVGDLVLGDVLSNSIEFYLRSDILEDGYGLKYWPIVNDASELINRAPTTVSTPENDARRAPRALKGPSSTNAYPDAGACEYTHLRVTTNAGSPANVNSFLWALEPAQQKDAFHFIEFDMPGPVPGGIICSSVGAVEGSAYIIDGYSQEFSSIPGPPTSGSSNLTPATIHVTLVGGASVLNGIECNSGSQNSTIQGLRINSFDLNGIRISEKNINVYGCEIGINSDGSIDGNNEVGIRIGIGSVECQIGGWQHYMRNVITGNGITSPDEEANIHIQGADSTTVSGNIIGGVQNGMSVPTFPEKSPSGIFIHSEYNVIGGSLINSGNIIVNNIDGIYMTRRADRNIIIRNKIGVGNNGFDAIGNEKNGINLVGADRNTIGSTNARLGNIIAHSLSGIILTTDVFPAKRNSFMGNSIHSNINQGIDFYNDNLSLPNDGLILASGQNEELDFPILDSSINCIAFNTVTHYQVSVPISETYRVEFFSNDTPDATHGEGQHFLGYTEITPTTNPQLFSYDHGTTLPPGTSLSATITRLSNNTTSEFGLNTTVTISGFAEISYEDICPGDTAFAVITGTAGGTFRFTNPTPTDGATIDADNGNVTNGVSGTTYTVIYNSGACSEEDTTTFNVFDVDASFVYNNLCPEEDGLPTSITSPGGSFAFNPLPGDGASINPTTGAITGTTPGASYTIEHTLTIGACTQIATQTIEVIDNDPSFSFNDICPGDSGSPYDISTVGGSFSFYYDGPFDGSVIGVTTGTLSGGIEGKTYNIVHTVGVCDAKDTVSITITAVPEDFVFDDFCPTNLSPTPVNEGAIGTFSMVDLGDGATINPDGSISNPVEGTTYTVTHLLSVSGCTQSATHDVTALEVDESFSFSSICPEETGLPSAITTPGGVFSFSTEPGDGASISAATGLLTNGIEGTNYNVQYAVSVGSCSDSISLIVPISIVEEGFTFADFCPGLTSPAPTVDVSGGAFSFGTAPADGATIDSDSGIITNPVEGETYEVLHTLTVGGCTQDSTIFVNVKTVLEEFVFDDICPTDLSPAPINEGPIGTFSMVDLGDGAAINADGTISDPVEGTTYTVSHTLTEVGCTQTYTADVTAIEVDEYFNFLPICPEESGSPIDIATAGGEFSFDPDLGDGSTLDAGTGLLSDGVEGVVYGVKYVVTFGSCFDSLTVNVPIVNVFEDFSFPDFCPGPESPMPIVVSPGGTFDFNTPPGDGATISPTNGIIYDPIEGNSYEVIHTREIAGCTQDSILTVSVIAIDSDFTMDDFCAGEVSPAASPETGAYSFTFPPPADGETIDPLTGIITGPIEGATYSIDRTVDDGTCIETTTHEVLVVGIDESFVFDSYCPDPTSPTPIPATPGGEFQFAPSLGDGATIDASSGIILNGIEGTTYPVEYTISTDHGDLTCTESDTIYVTVIPTDESFVFDNFCAEFNGMPSLIAEAGGTFAFAPDLGDGALIDTETGNITNAIAGSSYTIEYTVGECAERDSVLVLAMGTEDATFILNDHCSNISMLAEVGGAPGGTFSFSPEPVDGATINATTGEIIAPLLGGIYSVQYISPGSATTCPDTSSNPVTLFPSPEILTINTEDELYCPGEAYKALTVTESTSADQIYWMIDNEIIDSTSVFIPDTLLVGINTFQAQAYTLNGCLSEIKTVDYILSDTSGMKASENQQICLGTEAYISAEGGTNYLWITEVPLTDITLAEQEVFSITKQTYLVSIKNDDNCEVIDSVTIDFLPQIDCPITIYNAFSPNNDGKNDFWYIDNLINFVPNEVIIYNRWGDVVNSFENYDNINVYWSGEDKNGNPLAPGTYFYVVTSTDAEQNQASWVEIVR